MSIFVGVTSIASLLAEVLIKTKVFPSGTVEEINDELTKEDVSLQLAQQKARVAQELAIAFRIETADEVEIEEFYDTSGDGSVGVKGNKDGISIGVNGSGRKITKRIYKFKGLNEKKAEVYEQKLNESLVPTV